MFLTRSLLFRLCVVSLASLLAIASGVAAEKPVKVYILAGQSNMVGIGQVSGSSVRWGSEFSDAVLSVYAGYKDTAGEWKKGEEPAPGNWYGGKQYDECFDAVKEVLANFDEKYPQWKGRGYEIAGFGWWQGHKDGGEQGQGAAGPHAVRYEQNLVHLIKTLRKEFNAPDARFVVATCGFNGGEGWEPGSGADTIFNAQMNVSDPAKHPDFAGTVKSVDTRPFYRSAEVSPRDQSFHYHGNAETYMLVGEAMGKAMLEND